MGSRLLERYCSMNADEFVTLLMSRGLFSDLATRVSEHYSNWEAFSSAPPSKLSTEFNSSELEELRKAKSRRQIPKATVQRLIEECEFRCCLCWNVDSDAGVVIHHIRPHSSTPDDRYENLIVLCADHHARVHTTWELARHPFPPELLRIRKDRFVEAIAAFRLGHRSLLAEKKDMKKASSLRHQKAPQISLDGMPLSKILVSDWPHPTVACQLSEWEELEKLQSY